MTDETTLTDPHAHIADPLERAKAQGYTEPDEPSRDDRIRAVVEAIDHAHEHNAPISDHIVRELHDLFPDQSPVTETQAVADATGGEEDEPDGVGINL